MEYLHQPEERRPRLELWGGIEPTVNRVGDNYLDQLAFSGHDQRISDLDLVAGLGISTIRYPVLWERTAPEGVDRADWSWPDQRLRRLRELGIRPIVGLIHHGSGPRFTSLLDPGFAAGLAEYARAVAERYPWVDSYTPVNEPLTTARFSALYGHWYPHARDDESFVSAVVNQCQGVVLAMRAIREVNPRARLVQTEDLGKTFGTPELGDQVTFDNERRWLTFDLLAGRLNPDHFLWGYLCRLGFERALAWFLDNPCVPDVLGINHYVTSQRFLDHRLDSYPPHTHGGNGRQRYADVEVVRVCREGPEGAGALLGESWERYSLPLAVTEVHLGCTREEQLRWFMEIWREAGNLRRGGVDVRAVTAWSLFGAYDWDSLLTRMDGHYEPGVFDLQSPSPRPTALAHMISGLASGGQYDHPTLDVEGWWRRDDRLLYPPISRGPASPIQSSRSGSAGPIAQPRSLVIAGATGTLGRAFARLCQLRGLSYHLLTRQEMDIGDPASVEGALSRLEPWAVVNAAGYVRVDDAEGEPARCWRENVEGPMVLAGACGAREIPLVTFSSDLVFDGSSARPYLESDRVAPLNLYGQSKAAAEAVVLGSHPSSLVVRTSAFFGPWDEHNFVTIALRSLTRGTPFVAANDLIVSPTYVPDLVNAALDLLIDGETGLWHLSNRGELTWEELARLAARTAGLDPEGVEGRPWRSLGLTAPRPRHSSLGSERGWLLPSLENALARYLADSNAFSWTGEQAA